MGVGILSGCDLLPPQENIEAEFRGRLITGEKVSPQGGIIH